MVDADRVRRLLVMLERPAAESIMRATSVEVNID